MKVLFFLTLFSGIIPFAIFLSKKKILDFKEPIMPFIWLTALASLYEFFGTTLLRFNTSYWFQIYSLLEYITLYYFFFRLFRPSYKILFKIFLATGLLVYLISFFFWTSESALVSLGINIGPITLFVLTFSFLWFKDLFLRIDKKDPLKNPVFYFITGLSVYFSSVFFLFLLSHFIFTQGLGLNAYWQINIAALLLLRISLIIGVWKMYRN